MQIQKTFSNESLRTRILEEVCKMFKDPETEVRLLALKNVAFLADYITPENALNNLIPLFKEISDSSDIEARRKVSLSKALWLTQF